MDPNELTIEAIEKAAKHNPVIKKYLGEFSKHKLTYRQALIGMVLELNQEPAKEAKAEGTGNAPDKVSKKE
jgi:hypothetical protein